MNTTTAAVDLAKDVFQVVLADSDGHVLENHRLRRTQFERFFMNRRVDRIVMEACGSAHHWARTFGVRGVRVTLLPAQYVRAYVRRNKTDAADARALLEAARAEDIRAVPVKSVDQQALQGLHRIRSAWMGTRTARRSVGRVIGGRPDRPLGLGRGLAALIPQRAPHASGSIEIALDRIRDNPRQPRVRMDPDALATLAASVREHGIIQPILVTETLDGYQLVAGERRVRAAELAGLERVPAVVRQLAARDQLELALVENVQREDLDPIETAHAYRQLIDEFGFTQEQHAERVSEARSTVANTLRLLELDPAVQEAVGDGRITENLPPATFGL